MTHESLGSIKSNPPDPDDKEVAKKMRDVIAKMRPVKKCPAKGPAPAPKVEGPPPAGNKTKGQSKGKPSDKPPAETSHAIDGTQAERVTTVMGNHG